MELARNGLPPEEPEVLRAVSGLAWRAELQGRRPRSAAWLAAARTIIGANVRTAEALLREAHDVDLQRRLEELLVGRLEAGWVDRYVAVAGLAPDGPPSVFLALSAPHPLLAVRALVHLRPGLVALHPPEEPPGPTAVDRWLQRRFTALRLQVPVLWEASPAAVGRALAEGRDVHVTVEPARPIVSVEAALTAGTVLGAPWAAVLEGRAVRPVFVHRERDKRWRVEVGEATAPESALVRLAEHVRRWPGQHLPWVAGG